jgi:thiamine biosynthesis lipoprotein
VTSPALARTSFPALGGTVLVVSDDADDLRLVRALVERWEVVLSRFRPSSALCRLNAAGALSAPPAELVRGLRTAIAAAERSDGLVDPTLLPAVEAAGYTRSFVPGVRGRRPPAPGGRWREIHVDPERVELPAGVRIDLGGTAKGLVADVAVESMAGARVAVNAGGDLRVRGGGFHSELRVLRGAAHPGDAAVPIDAGALATSGVSHRRWPTTDGGTAHHLIDPRTGAPAVTPWLACTAWAPTCVHAEVAAKTGLLAGPDRLHALGVPARLVAADGSIATTGPWA